MAVNLSVRTKDEARRIDPAGADTERGRAERRVQRAARQEPRDVRLGSRGRSDAEAHEIDVSVGRDMDGSGDGRGETDRGIEGGVARTVDIETHQARGWSARDAPKCAGDNELAVGLHGERGRTAVEHRSGEGRVKRAIGVEAD